MPPRLVCQVLRIKPGASCVLGRCCQLSYYISQPVFPLCQFRGAPLLGHPPWGWSPLTAACDLPGALETLPLSAQTCSHRIPTDWFPRSGKTEARQNETRTLASDPYGLGVTWTFCFDNMMSCPCVWRGAGCSHPRPVLEIKLMAELFPEKEDGPWESTGPQALLNHLVRGRVSVAGSLLLSESPVPSFNLAKS